MQLILKLQRSSEAEIVGSTRVFTQEGGIIGRLPTCLWQLKDVSCSLSREHAKIYVQNGMFYLEDNSSNGVFINDSIMPIGQGRFHQLNAGDKIAMGDYVFTVDSIQADEFISMDERIPQLDIHLNPANPIGSGVDLSYDSQGSISDLFAEENSVVKSNLEDSTHLFSSSVSDDVIAKNSDEFMADLTGDTLLNELHPDQQFFSQGKDSHDMEMGSAFKMPGVIPDEVNFLQQDTMNAANEKSISQEVSDSLNTHIEVEDIILDNTAAEPIQEKIAENISLLDDHNSNSAQQQSEPDLGRNAIDEPMNMIPNGFIPDLSLTGDDSFATDNTILPAAESGEIKADEAIIDKSAANIQQNEPRQQLIPDDYVPGMDIINNSHGLESTVNSFAIDTDTEDKEINYKKVVNEFLIALDLNIEQYDNDSLNRLMKRMAGIIMQYSMEHPVDLTPDTATNLTSNATTDK